MADEKPFDPLIYPVCVRVYRGCIEVSQPDLGFYEGTLRWDELKKGQQIGDLVLAMMDKTIRKLSEMKAKGQTLPAPSSPKDALGIPKNRYCTIKEASEYLDVSESSVRRLCNSGELKSQRTRGGHRKIHFEDLQNYKSHGNVPVHYHAEPKQEEPLLSLFDMFLTDEKGETSPSE